MSEKEGNNFGLPSYEEAISSKEPREPEKIDNGIIHYVQSTDTLVGLSLKYNVKVACCSTMLWGNTYYYLQKEWICRANNLTHDNIICRKKLIIPFTDRQSFSTKPAPDPRQVAIQTFQREAQIVLLQRFDRKDVWVDRSEATSYLEMSDWDVHKAIKGWVKDFEWESKNPFEGTSSKFKNR
jgi:hypothetical protein